jgi:hypothetical protein
LVVLISLSNAAARDENAILGFVNLPKMPNLSGETWAARALKFKTFASKWH